MRNKKQCNKLNIFYSLSIKLNNKFYKNEKNLKLVDYRLILDGTI